MQYTIGDVLTVIGFIAGIYVSIWALIVGFALLFANRAAVARAHLAETPWRVLILGTSLAIIGGFLVVVLIGLHNPITTLMGWILALEMIAMAVVGGSGLALVMGVRMQQMDRRCSPFRGMARSAGLMVLAALLPVFGWAVALISTLASLGAGFQAILFPHSYPVPHAARRQPPVYATGEASSNGPTHPPEFHV